MTSYGNWKCVFQAGISKSINSEIKFVRVTKLNKPDNKLTFVDIRTYQYGKATKKGICITPVEYKWVIKQFEKNRKTGNQDNGNRSLNMKKCNEGVILKLVTPLKEVVYKLFDRDIKNLLKKNTKVIYYLQESKPKQKTNYSSEDEDDHDFGENVEKTTIKKRKNSKSNVDDEITDDENTPIKKKKEVKQICKAGVKNIKSEVISEDDDASGDDLLFVNESDDESSISSLEKDTVVREELLNSKDDDL